MAPRRYRPTWVEVYVDRIEENARRICRFAREKGVGLIGVVKANGYGHGAVETARAALKGGADSLAVALPEEGVALRDAGVTAPILVMGAYVSGTIDAYLDYDLDVTVGGEDQVRALAQDAGMVQSGRSVSVHLKVDTGMGRHGVMPEEVLTVAEEIIAYEGLELKGLYSHLATADEVEPDYANAQLKRFNELVEALEAQGIHPSCIHVLNAGGLLQHHPGRSNFARVGIGLYGLYPSAHLRGVVELLPALSWKTKVAAIKEVPPGMGVSYGKTYVTKKTTRLATIPVGYADGFSRNLGNQASVLIRGKRFPVVGRVCMDQAVVDVGDEAVDLGDEVVLIGSQGEEHVTADEWADMLGTINYEVICTVSARVPRIYKKAQGQFG